MRQFFSLVLILFLYTSVTAKVLHTGYNQPYKDISTAAKAVLPGDTILVYKGTYPGGQSLHGLQGMPGKWIYILAEKNGTVLFEGGSAAWRGSDISYLHIEGFVFSKQTANGVNFDDGGSYESPSHHIVLKHCTFSDMAATGNNDLLKLSGVDNFNIAHCTFINGSIGGSGIDMVGCHKGILRNCYFENMGTNAIQMKGGSSEVQVEGCMFKNAGSRAINLGGSTAKDFFRPRTATWEASLLKVYSNVFIGSDVPVAFVGCTQSEVANNTIYKPQKWVIRILQENRDTIRFGKCGNNSFLNNAIYIDRKVQTACSIGPGTAPQSFIFSNNAWYNADNSNWMGPRLPVVDSSAIIGKNPLFVNPTQGDFSITKNSSLVAAGVKLSFPEKDNAGHRFLPKRAIGAFEVR